MSHSGAAHAALRSPGGVGADRGPSLDAIARSRGLRLGSAIKWDQVDEADLTALFTEECGLVVAENAFKWKMIEPKPSAFRWERPDAVARFADENALGLRGHTLVWNQDNRVPPWLLDAEPHLGDGARQAIGGLVIDYVNAMAARYPSVISWDAVNEAIRPWQGDLRESVWTRTIGDDFGVLTFEAAREAMPDTQLVYNDYPSWQKRPAHREGVLRYLEGLLAAGAPVDALGIQSHLAATVTDYDEAAWRAFLEEVRGMGLDVLITELDCGDRQVEATDTDTRDRIVADHVRRYLDLTLSFENVTQVVLWGLTDRDSYTRQPYFAQAKRRPDGLPQRTHPYDAALRPKPIRAAIARALAAAPKREGAFPPLIAE